MRWCWMIAATVAAAVISHEAIAAEQPGPRPDRSGPGPMVMFERLDRNSDGVIEASEVPEGAPEPIKQFLRRADRNDDKKIAKDEFAAAMRADLPMRGPQRPGERDARGRADGTPKRDGHRAAEADRRGDRGPSDRPPSRPEARERGPRDRGPSGPPQWHGRGPQRGPVAPQWVARGLRRGPVGPAFGPWRGPWAGKGPAMPPQAKHPSARWGKPSPVARGGEVEQLQERVRQLQHELKVIEAKLSKQSPPNAEDKPDKPAPKAKAPHSRGEKPAKPEKHERK